MWPMEQNLESRNNAIHTWLNDFQKTTKIISMKKWIIFSTRDTRTTPHTY